MPLVTRAMIAEKFGIKKTGPTHVVNNFIQSDGYALKDIEEKLTQYAMQDFLGTEEEGLPELWDMMIAKIEGRYTEPVKEKMEAAMTNEEAKDFLEKTIGVNKKKNAK